MTPAEFQTAVGTNTETMDKLRVYADLLVKWQAKINLVGPDTLTDLWSRHMYDSAQLLPFLGLSAEHPKCLVDIGSGAGFPGLVLAILAGDNLSAVHLVESDLRKCSFLREVNRATDAGATIHTARIEAMDSLGADILTSRALANFDKLMGFADIHCLSTGKCIFPKGKKWLGELTDAQKNWSMQVQEHKGELEPAGRILEISAFSKI